MACRVQGQSSDADSDRLQGLEMSRMELDHLRPWRMRLNRLQKASLAVARDVWVAFTDDEDAVRCDAREIFSWVHPNKRVGVVCELLLRVASHPLCAGVCERLNDTTS